MENVWLKAWLSVAFRLPEDGVSVSVGAFSVIEYAWLPEKPLLSVALSVKLNVPPAVGVPDSVPVELSVKPTGRAPAVTAYVYGPLPPLALTAWLYAVAIAGLGSVAGATAMVGTDTVSAYVPVTAYGPLPELLSVAVTLKLTVPAVVGVPDSVAVPAFQLRPVGKLPLLTTKV
ncbi:hypothetical protein LMG18101_05256 [Ralstonia flaminis]|uniref:Uncharacterized protein n=1 Tax=Ralstonia flaminis TaxID=3058597 RepID=A0ABM9KDQ9_9RALS|nr:hypothetical protein LMG18101_05256 [Ralstonia sp. LMG 18101]